MMGLLLACLSRWRRHARTHAHGPDVGGVPFRALLLPGRSQTALSVLSYHTTFASFRDGQGRPASRESGVPESPP